MFRIGFGYDTHRLAESRDLIIGGVKIPFHLGLDGHSDADVLTHAIIDGILGAMAMGDIGSHFPDTDPVFKDANSQSLLEKTMELVTANGYMVNNLDTTVVAEKPKLQFYIPSMKKVLSGSLGIEPNRISIKATTNEKMGFCGRGEGIGAFAVISLIKI